MISQLNKYLQSLPNENQPHDLDNELCSSQILLSSLTATSSPENNTPNTTKNKGVIEENKQVEDDVAKIDLSDVKIDIAKADSSNTPSLGDVWNIINFLDTGGQPEFGNILPAVSSSIGLTFIVFSLNKSLNNLVHVEHNVNGDPSFEPYDLDCTNEDFIKHLMVSSENFNKKLYH